MRKSPFVPQQFAGAEYDPEVHKSSTVLAGSAIQQVKCYHAIPINLLTQRAKPCLFVAVSDA